MGMMLRITPEGEFTRAATWELCRAGLSRGVAWNILQRFGSYPIQIKDLQNGHIAIINRQIVKIHHCIYETPFRGNFKIDTQFYKRSKKGHMKFRSVITTFRCSGNEIVNRLVPLWCQKI